MPDIHDVIRDQVFGKIAELIEKDEISDEAIHAITSCFDDMPEDWEHPCGCGTCQSYND